MFSRPSRQTTLTPKKPREIDESKKHCISFSGGKDSSALLARMLELGLPVDRVIFAETCGPEQCVKGRWF